MAFVRFGTDSDVYVYQSETSLTCCQCKLNFDQDVEFEAGRVEAIIPHLEEHLLTGHKIPEGTIDRLKNEVKDIDKDLRRRKKFNRQY